jgi:hypothetical protein
MSALPSLPQGPSLGKRRFNVAPLTSTETHVGLFNKRLKKEDPVEDDDGDGMKDEGDEKTSKEPKPKWSGFEKPKTVAMEIVQEKKVPVPSVAERRKKEAADKRLSKAESFLYSTDASQLVRPLLLIPPLERIKVIQSVYTISNAALKEPAQAPLIIKRIEWIRRFYLNEMIKDPSGVLFPRYPMNVPGVHIDWQILAWWFVGLLQINTKAVRQADRFELRCKESIYLGSFQDWMIEFLLPLWPDLEHKDKVARLQNPISPDDIPHRRRLNWIHTYFETPPSFRMNERLGAKQAHEDWRHLILWKAGQLEPKTAMVQQFRLGSQKVEPFACLNQCRLPTRRDEDGTVDIDVLIHSFLTSSERIMIQKRLCKSRHFLTNVTCGGDWRMFNEVADLPIMPHIMCRQAAVAIGTTMDTYFTVDGDVPFWGAIEMLEDGKSPSHLSDDQHQMSFRGSEATPSRVRKLMIPDDQIENKFLPICRAVIQPFRRAMAWSVHDLIKAYVLTDAQRIDILALFTSCLKGEMLPDIDKMGRVSNVLCQYVWAGKRPDAVQDFLDEHKDIHDLWMERRPVASYDLRIKEKPVRLNDPLWSATETEMVFYWTSTDDEARGIGPRVMFAFYPQRRLLVCNDFDKYELVDRVGPRLHGGSRPSVFLSLVLDPVKRKQRGDLFERHHKKWTRILPKWKPIYDRTKDPKDMIGSVLRADVIRETVEDLIVRD